MKNIKNLIPHFLKCKKNQRLFALLLLLAFAGNLPLAAQAASPSEYIKFKVSPERSYLLPGNAANCSDLANYKRQVLNPPKGSSTPPLQTSISALRVSFPKFSLSWTSRDTLVVSYIELRIRSPYILGGNFQYSISNIELSQLLGRTSNTFMGQNDMIYSTGIVANPIGTGTILSNDPARDCMPSIDRNVMTGEVCIPQVQIYTSSAAACGFDVGGVTLANLAPGHFTTPYTLRLIGYSVNVNGTETPVQSEITGSLIYTGIH